MGQVPSQLQVTSRSLRIHSLNHHALTHNRYCCPLSPRPSHPRGYTSSTNNHPISATTNPNNLSQNISRRVVCVGRCLELVLSLVLLAFDRVDAYLFVVLLEGSQILSGLAELALFHTFTDIPVDEGTLGVHKIELVVKSSPSLGNSRGVAQHAHGTLDLGQVTTGNNGRGLVVDTDLETGRAPVNELDGSLGLDGGNGGVDVLGDDVTSVEHTASHVFSVSGVALDHLVGGLEARVGNLGNGELLVVGLLGGDARGVGDKREVDSGVGYQVGLELGKIDVESTIESERGGDRRDDLTDESIQVGVGGSLDIQVSSADVVDGLVVYHKGAVRVLQSGMCREDRVVRLDDGRGDLRSRVDGKFELGLLAVVDGESLHKKRGKSGSGTATKGVEDEETLKTSALIGELSDSVEHKVDDLLTDGVVTSGVVVGGILLTGDELFGVGELSVGTSSHLIDYGGLQIDKDGARDVLAGTSLGEKGVERVVSASDGLVAGHLSIWLDAVLEAVELPTGVTDLDTGLSDVDGDTLSHGSVLCGWL